MIELLNKIVEYFVWLFSIAVMIGKAIITFIISLIK